MDLLKIVERVDNVLEAVHVVPVDVPVPQVPVARVLDIPHIIVHDLPRDVLSKLNIPFKHRHLELAQHRFKFVFGLVEFLDKLPVKEGLVQNNLLETNSETLEVVVDSLQSSVKRKFLEVTAIQGIVKMLGDVFPGWQPVISLLLPGVVMVSP